MFAFILITFIALTPSRVFALGPCTGEKCEQGIPGISVNGIDGDGLRPDGSDETSNVVGYGGNLNVVVRFFAKADKNAMPIRKVAIAWGKSSSSTRDVYPREGRFKNHLGLKSDNSSWCDNDNFGQSEDACTDGYMQSSTVYTCPRNGGDLPPCTGAEGETGCFADARTGTECPEDVNAAIPGNGSCCIYKPKVQLKDNWGWCNGTCPGRAMGCYDARPTGDDECNPYDNTYNHWTPFAGRVIVVPR